MPAKKEDALAAEKPSFNRGSDGRTSFRVPSFRNDMCAAPFAHGPECLPSRPVPIPAHLCCAGTICCRSPCSGPEVAST